IMEQGARAENLVEAAWLAYGKVAPALEELNHEAEFWLRFQLQTDSADAEYWLVAQWAHLMAVRVSIHDPIQNDWWHSAAVGLATDPAERYLRHRYPVFPLSLPADRPVTVYMGIRSNTFTVFPVRVWQPDA